MIVLDTTASTLAPNISFPKWEEGSWIRSAVPLGALKIQAFGIYMFICNLNKKEIVKYPVQLWKPYLKIYDNVYKAEKEIVSPAILCIIYLCI